ALSLLDQRPAFAVRGREGGAGRTASLLGAIAGGLRRHGAAPPPPGRLARPDDAVRRRPPPPGRAGGDLPRGGRRRGAVRPRREPRALWRACPPLPPRRRAGRADLLLRSGGRRELEGGGESPGRRVANGVDRPPVDLGA